MGANASGASQLPDEIRPYAWVMITVSNLLSVVACIWLLRRFMRQTGRASKLLLARQLLHLATADLLSAFLAITAVVMDVFKFWEHMSTMPAVADTLCLPLQLIGLGNVIVSVLLETHLAVSFACSYWRQMEALEYLQRSLVWLWLIGYGLGTVAVLSHYNSADKESAHTCQDKTKVLQYQGTVFVIVCFLMSLLWYLATLRRVHGYPNSVRSVVQRMAWIYPINFFVTYGMFVIYYLVLQERHPWFLIVAFSLVGLNGFVNSASYLTNSRYIRKHLGVSSSPLSTQANGTGTCCNRLSGVESTSDPDCLKAFVEFHVGFRENIESVLHMSEATGTTSHTAMTDHSTPSQRDRAEILLADLTMQDTQILAITARLAEQQRGSDVPVPRLPTHDVLSASTSELDLLEQRMIDRNSWIEHHRVMLDADADSVAH
eukprot:TRINITY_DN26214_c0_g1_i1.p1 TRINITY_DN26214_c0_g1~~TRINITY_DN26214_c0_g1_i1.p1  ORF type:complete len:464 (-),score=39.42 TRINITY_DN26214_c0_g1_i1:280-1575(-)